MSGNMLASFEAERKKAPRAANALLGGWLNDDSTRAALYAEMRASDREVLRFDSVEGTAYGGKARQAYLLSSRSDIELALKHFSVRPYAALGGGRFMLAIDDPQLHDAQREFAARHLRYDPKLVEDCATEAFRRAAILPLKQARFDLPTLAEQAALRFVEQLFGLPEVDFAVLAGTMRRAYLELTFRIIGRHFDDELEPRLPLPSDIVPLDQCLRGLFNGSRTEKTSPPPWSSRHLKGETIVERMRAFPNGHPHDMLEAILTGLMAGTVGNVQAAVTIALDDFFSAPDGRISEARRAALDGDDDALWNLIRAALTRNPPAAFLARLADGSHVIVEENGQRQPIPKDAEVLLAIGGSGSPDLVFGGPSGDGGYVHQCVGEHLAKPLVRRIVREVLRLPGLAQSIDADSGAPVRPQKRWGVICREYPLTYSRRRQLNQSPLMVIMRIRPPVRENAGRIIRLIAAGAPTIEDALRESGHVHVAWFGLVSGGTELALYTVYDGEFDAYIEHFALNVELFDELFQFIEDPPPTPVRRHPKEFVEKIRQYDRAPVGNYFFSACPTMPVADIRNRLPPWERP